MVAVVALAALCARRRWSRRVYIAVIFGVGEFSKYCVVPPREGVCLCVWVRISETVVIRVQWMEAQKLSEQNKRRAASSDS
uniref:Putative secreted protein n=1 Tax=Anopheles darlingi TaxID=43151 RepID=A0A2M4DDP2_ANODA